MVHENGIRGLEKGVTMRAMGARADLLGRETELATLVDRIAEDRPLVVAGEAGIGKTRLLEAAAAAAGRRAVAIGGMATLAGRSKAALRRLLGPGVDGDAEYLAAEVEGRVGPDVLLADDVQWLDPVTQDVLARLVSRIAVIASVRTGSEAATAALERLSGLGFERLDLGPLDAGVSAELATRARPGLSTGEARRIGERAGGNPFFILELASAGRTVGSDVIVRIRLADLGPAALESARRLAVLGRPTNLGMLGDGGRELVESGIAVADGDRVAFQHQLFAEQIIEALEPSDLRRIQLELAARTNDAIESARLFLAAGARAEAVAAAQRAESAADNVGDRVEALRLRAAAADDASGPALRLAAAAQLSDIHDYAGAGEMVDGVAAWDAGSAARIAAIRGKVTGILGKVDEAKAILATAIEQATPLVEGGDPDAAETLTDALASEAQMQAWSGDPAAGLAAAEHGVALADRFGLAGARARTLLGYMLVTADRSEEAVVHLRAALEARRRDGDGPGELQALNVLLLAEMSVSGTTEALETCRVLTARAIELHLYDNWRGYQPYLMFLLDAAGRYREALDVAENLLIAPVHARGAIYGPGYAALACARLGRFEVGRSIIAALEPRRSEDPEVERIYLDTLATIELAQGRPSQALRLFELLVALPQKSESDEMEPRLSAMWARRDLGRDPGAAIDPGSTPRVAGVGPESRGLVEVHAGDYDAATAAFDEAAAAWSPFLTWNADRSRWAAAESERLAGRTESATERLLAAETIALEREARPQLTRIHRSLRLLGVRRGAPRSASGPDLLTARERELVDLVAAGLNNVEIGRRLGLGRGTVRRLLSSAMAKLGADTRSQAVALVEA
jgi:DNA-binding CsgD family transcriptional regulator